ncbi:MAG: hypothetical protein Q7U52_17580 [Hydrogenophaga sp.]|nr:hypothetical protein [Hydrogenophaga sp.]
MGLIEWMEVASYVVTVIGLPLAIGVFVMEQRKERINEEEEIHQRLSDGYTDFLKLVLDHPDLHLMRRSGAPLVLSAEQQERKDILFGLLISLFERAYLLVYEEGMSSKTRRLWQSWEDYMREWCRREDFRRALPELLRGEDPDFCTLILRIATEEADPPATG